MSNAPQNADTDQPANDFDKKLAAVDDLSFEQAMEHLEQVVNDLERGNINLDQSLKAYEYGMALKNHCADRLKKAEQKIEKIMQQSDGSIKKMPMDDAK